MTASRPVQVQTAEDTRISAFRLLTESYLNTLGNVQVYAELVVAGFNFDAIWVRL